MGEWLIFFDQHTRPTCGENPWRLLQMDGHKSHLDLDLWMLAHQLKISIVISPANCTNWLQPLDVGVFAPLKQEYRRFLEVYNQFGFKKMERRLIIEKLPAMRTKTMTWNVVGKAFAKCGILPSRIDFSSIIERAQLDTTPPPPDPSLTAAVTPLDLTTPRSSQ